MSLTVQIKNVCACCEGVLRTTNRKINADQLDRLFLDLIYVTEGEGGAVLAEKTDELCSTCEQQEKLNSYGPDYEPREAWLQNRQGMISTTDEA